MSARPSVQITYFIEIVSSWCWWAEPAWAALKERYAGRVEFDWKIALMDASGLPLSKSQSEWFYRRSGVVTRSPYMLDAGWFDPELKEYLAPNCMAEAARVLGVTDDRARLAVARAAVREGRPVGRWEVSAEVVAAATGLDASSLLSTAKSNEVEERCRRSTVEFHSLKVTQRPTFLIESTIADRVVFSGTWRAEPIAAALDSLLEDAQSYASYAAHHGGPPAS